MNWLIILFGLAAVGKTHSNHGHRHGQRSKINAFHPVSQVNVRDDGERTSGRLAPRKLVTFDVEPGWAVTMNLELALIFDKDATVENHLEDGTIVTLPKTERTYTGYARATRFNETMESEHLSVIFHAEDRKDHHETETVFHAIILFPHATWTIDPARRHKQNGEMVMWRKDDLLVKEEGKWVSPREKTWDSLLNHGRLGNGRKLLALEKFDNNCWPGQGQMVAEVSLGILMDNGFVAASGGTAAATAFATEIISDTNTLYRRQLDVQFYIGSMLQGNGVPGFNFNEAPARSGTKTCPSGMDAQERLYALEAWRRTRKPNDQGLWHLLTDCHPPPGTVGIAFVGVICQVSAGVGLSTYMTNRPSETWEVVAHEIGHNFGSGHSFDNGQGRTGGIMDYGDGLFNGVYQFNPLRETEICDEISVSMQKTQGVVDRCWRPYAQNNQFYEWHQTGEWTDCYPSCGYHSHQSNIIKCRLHGTTGNAVYVDDSFCDAKTKPRDGSTKIQCTNDPANVGTPTNPSGFKLVRNFNDNCPNNLCGNGQIDPEEICDTQLEPTCCLNCVAWAQTAGCDVDNPIVDAGFMESSGAVWLFQADEVARYDNINEIKPSGNYPVPIANLISNIAPSFSSSIGAVIAQPDNEVYMFKDDEYIKVDWDTKKMMADGAYPLKTADLLNLSTRNDNENFQTCLTDYGASAGISTPEGGALICNGILVRFKFGFDADPGTVPVPVEFSNVHDQFGTDSIINAVVANVRNGRMRVYSADKNIVWFAGKVEQSVQQTTGMGIARISDSGKCAVPNCNACRGSDPNTCQLCNEEFYLQGSTCYHNRFLMVVSFDEGNIDDYAHFEGGKTTADGLTYVDGHTTGSQAVQLRSTEKIELKGKSKLTDSWRISFWWKPNVYTKGKVVTMMRDRQGQGEKESVEIWFDMSKTGQTVAADTFALHVKFYNNTLQCYVDKPATVDEWNKIAVSFDNKVFTTEVNGYSHKTAWNVFEDTEDTQVDFSEWYIGSDTGGISGAIDNFSVEILGGSVNVELPKFAVLAILAVAGLFAIGTCYVFSLRFGIKFWGGEERAAPGRSYPAPSSTAPGGGRFGASNI